MNGRNSKCVRVLAGVGGAAVLLGVLSAAGCSKPLLSPEANRSQYDRYDAVRNQYASQFTEDEFGRRRPNLKGRLMPKN